MADNLIVNKAKLTVTDLKGLCQKHPYVRGRAGAAMIFRKWYSKCSAILVGWGCFNAGYGSK